MTTKKTETDTAERKESEPGARDLELAQRVHTLAHLVYGEIVAAHPWVASSLSPNGYQVPTAWPPVMPPGASSHWAGSAWTW
jgi:hypothetical protein